MSRHIQLTSTTPGIGKIRVHPDLLAAYFRQGGKTSIFLAAHGNPIQTPVGAVVPGLAETVVETPEEIDKLIAVARKPVFDA